MTKPYAILPVVNSRKVIIIDAPLHSTLSRFSWDIPKGTYAGSPRPFTRINENGKRRHVTLARAITKAPDGMYPKHLNGNHLDCRRENIELVDTKDKAGNQ